MEQKAKFFIFGLIGILIILLIFLGYTLNSVKGIEKERNDLKRELSAAEAKFD